MDLTWLKIVREAISLTVFLVFAVTAYREQIGMNQIISPALNLAAVFFAFRDGPPVR